MRSVSAPNPNTQRWMVLVALAVSTLLTLTGCGTPGSTLGKPNKLNAGPATQLALTAITPPVLLYIGTGTSAPDVSAVKAILGTNKLTYATATTSQLNAMSETQLKAYKLLIVPGGNSITIGNSLTAATTTNIRNAVQKDGMHYLGICAGAFFGGYSIHNGVNLTSGVWFNFYADYNKGIHKEGVEIKFPSTLQYDIYWQDGPQLSGWGSIVGKYPDGTPAIVEGKSGIGWVLLMGVHPEAPASWWYGMKSTTPIATDLAYAATLVNAALNGTNLSHY